MGILFFFNVLFFFFIAWETLRAILCVCLSSERPSETICYKHLNLYLAENKALHTGLPFEFNGTKRKNAFTYQTGIAVFFVFKNMFGTCILCKLCVFFGIWWDNSCMNCKAECIHISLQTALCIKLNKILF